MSEWRFLEDTLSSCRIAKVLDKMVWELLKDLFSLQALWPYPIQAIHIWATTTPAPGIHPPPGSSAKLYVFCLFVFCFCFTILKQILKCDIVYEKKTNKKKTIDILMCSDILETKEKEKKGKEKITPKFITLIAVNI